MRKETNSPLSGTRGAGRLSAHKVSISDAVSNVDSQEDNNARSINLKLGSRKQRSSQFNNLEYMQEYYQS